MVRFVTGPTDVFRSGVKTAIEDRDGFSVARRSVSHANQDLCNQDHCKSRSEGGMNHAGH